ncbi:MAG: plastocyanin/azurin family copper-binding protein [Verrucomicrobiota bacterium]
MLAAALFSSSGFGGGRAARAITIVDQNGRLVPNTPPSGTSQIVDVTVGPNGTRQFSPTTVNISTGDTVRWTWGSNNHSVTSGASCSIDSQFCSPDDTNCSAGLLSDSGTVYLHTFNQAGTYSYFCAVHCFSGMVGMVNVAGAAPLQLSSAVSRKMHGAAGTFDVPLPLSGEPGVECRSTGGSYTLVFTTNNNLVSGNASVTTGVGAVSGSPTFSANTMTVNLTGVADVQKIIVTLSGVTDTSAQVLANTPVSINMLIGDTNANKSVAASDVAQTKGQSGLPATGANFRTDVTANGSIGASDIALVKSRSGASVP